MKTQEIASAAGMPKSHRASVKPGDGGPAVVSTRPPLAVQSIPFRLGAIFGTSSSPACPAELTKAALRACMDDRSQRSAIFIGLAENQWDFHRSDPPCQAFGPLQGRRRTSAGWWPRAMGKLPEVAEVGAGQYGRPGLQQLHPHTATKLNYLVYQEELRAPLLRSLQ